MGRRWDVDADEMDEIWMEWYKMRYGCEWDMEGNEIRYRRGWHGLDVGLGNVMDKGWNRA